MQVRDHPEYSVRAPRGFWPGRIKPAQEAESAQTPQQRLIQAMMFPLPKTDLGVSARADYLETEADDKQVSLDVYFEGDRFDYRDQGQGKDVNLEVLYLIYDSSGKQVEGISGSVEAHLTQQGMERAQSGGYRFSRRVALKPGVYQVRAGVREEGSDRLGTATTWVEVPQAKPGALEMSSLILSNPLDMNLEAAKDIDVNGLEQIKMVQGIPMYSQDDIFYYTYRVRRGGDDVSDAGLLLKRELLQGGEPVKTDDWRPAAALDVSDGKGWSDYDGELDISELDPGAYELRISLKEGPSGKAVSRSVAFGIL